MLVEVDSRGRFVGVVARVWGGLGGGGAGGGGFAGVETGFGVGREGVVRSRHCCAGKEGVSEIQE